MLSIPVIVAVEEPLASTSLIFIKILEVFDYVNTFLGGGMIDVELDPIHYETAYGKSLNRYRQRTENSVEESYITISLQENVNEYTLPDEIIEVRQIFKFSKIGKIAGSYVKEGIIKRNALARIFRVRDQVFEGKIN